MITENLSTLKIHKLTQAQYERELEAGRIDESALYLTPDEDIDLSGYATISDIEELQAKVGNKKVSEQISEAVNKIDYPVDSVNGKTGAVTLTAADVGALPAEDGYNMFEYTKMVGAPYNLLVNSDFRNPVNRNGVTNGTFTAWTYFIDKWTTDADELTLSFNSGGLSINNIITQFVYVGTISKTLTFAAKINGEVYVCSGIYQCANEYNRISYQNLDIGGYIAFDDDGNQNIRVLINPISTVTVEWAALYEGEYNAYTLPKYQPKGYTVELAACCGIAPSGYGLGELRGKLITDCNDALENGWYYSTGNCANAPNEHDFTMLVIASGGYTQTQIASLGNNFSYDPFLVARKNSAGKGWSAWKQIGVVKTKLWENASLTSNFAAQTIYLDLSSYDAVYVEAIRSTDANKISGRTVVYVGGLPSYLMGTTNEFALTRREVSATATGVTFTGFYSANTTNGTSNEIPYRIYGIKGVG